MKKYNRICILGLGYVGLPLLIGLSKNFEVIGFDISKQRVKQLKTGYDDNGEFKRCQIKNTILFTNKKTEIRDCNIYILTVPTPIDQNNIPNLEPLKTCCELISKYLNKGDIVCFESTVFPGVTEEICVPILENGSKLQYIKDFNVGYSPERINPGDKKNKVENIVKLLAASNLYTLRTLKTIYKSFIKSEIKICDTIKIAESAKVLENTQRDVNIALINEFYSVLSTLNVDTFKVIEAAASKWNFHKYTPGLVGGHCISVDPYYFAFKAGTVGIKTNLLLAARQTNEQLSSVIVENLLKYLLSRQTKNLSENILLVGAAFKENCSDFRNTKVIDVYKKLESYGLNIYIYDPLVNKKKFFEEYKIDLITKLDKNFNTALFLVSHDYFDDIFWKNLIAKNKLNLIYDLKGKLNHLGDKVKIIK